MIDVETKAKQIARDICKGNTICTCQNKDGHCASIMAIAKRLAEQGYTKQKRGNRVKIKPVDDYADFDPRDWDFI